MAVDHAHQPAGTVDPLVLAQWRAAEDRLYSLVTVDPEGYERVVSLVGRMVPALRTRDGGRVETLVALADDPARVCGEAGLDPHDTAGLDLLTLTRAACALRAAELVVPPDADA